MEEVKEHLSSEEISLITGPRQSGKTTLMKEIKNELERKGRNTIYLSMDIESHRRHFSSQQELKQKLELELGDSGVAFIDEIQRKENAGLFLKGIYDSDVPWKLVVSGSGSVELKENIHESLAGRKRLFHLSTITFREFVDYKTDYRYEGKLEKFFEAEPERTRQLLKEYMNFGGYPDVVLADKESEKRRIIDEIYSSYLERDIQNLLNVEKIDAFSTMIALLADQMGGLINYSSLSSDLEIGSSTVREYMKYAEKTYLIERVNPFFTNKRKELVKSPVAYFQDIGLRNYAVNQLGQIDLPTEKGIVFEGLVFQILRHNMTHSSGSIRYWRTKSGAEVDFVLKWGKDRVLPVEAKFRDLEEPEITRSFRSFLKKYSPEEAWVVNLALEETQEFEGVPVKFIPVSRLALGFEPDKLPL